MKYTVTYSCGHTETVQLFGPTSERERKLAWYADYGLCPACYKAQKEAERKAESEKLASVYTVPALTGTERQIAWAETLRSSWLKEIEEYIARYGANEPERTAEIRRAVSAMLAEHTDSSFWIDTRDETFASGKSLRRDTLKAILAAQQESGESEPEQPAEEPASEIQAQPAESETIVENKNPEDGQKGSEMKIDYEALDRAYGIIRAAGIKLPIDEDDYFALLRDARGAGIIDEEIDDVDGIVFADAVLKCAELVRNPDLLLPASRFYDCLNGDGYLSAEQPLEAITLKHKYLLGRWLLHNADERTAIETALSSMEAMSERFRGFRSNGVTLYGYMIPDLITLRLLCDRR